MKGLQMDKQAKVLYLSTVGILLIGLCFAVMGPLFFPEQQGVQTVTTAAEPSAAPVDPVLAFQEERSEVRERELQELRKIIDDPASESQLRSDAGERMMQLMRWTELEATLEGVLRVRGYQDAVVTVHQDSANVLIRRDSLTRQESAQVLELVSRETGLMGGNIKIIPVGS